MEWRDEDEERDRKRENPPMAECRSCKATIMWCRTAAGQRIPMDTAPVTDGNMVIVDGIARARQEVDIQLGRAAYKTHFATCPQGAMFRRQKHDR